MPKQLIYQSYSIPGAGATKTFSVNENVDTYFLKPATSPCLLLANMIINPTGTPNEGTCYTFEHAGGVTADGGFIVIFGHTLNAYEMAYPTTIKCVYINSAWVVKSWFGSDASSSQTIDGKYIKDATLDGGAIKSADIPYSKLVVAAARGYALRAGVGGAIESFNAVTAGNVVMGNGTDVLSQAITGHIALSGAGVTTIQNGVITQEMLAYTPEEYYIAELEITSAQILALNGTPLTIVAAPGSGKYIEAISATSQMTFVSAAYATNTTMQLINDGATVAQLQDTAILISTVTKNTKFQQVTAATAGQTQIITNTALQVKVATGNPITGDSAIKVSVIYRIVTV